MKESRIPYLIPARLQSGKFQENIPVSLAIINLFRRENKFKKKKSEEAKKKNFICSFIVYWLYFASPFCVCNASHLEITKLLVFQ